MVDFEIDSYRFEFGAPIQKILSFSHTKSVENHFASGPFQLQNIDYLCWESNRICNPNDRAKKIVEVLSLCCDLKER
ncbi:MAG: hypothetical protein M3139_02320 [Bacteroidota bacterium]|nr:hypothetical protein [Bacteroidota bacterium]